MAYVGYEEPCVGYGACNQHNQVNPAVPWRWVTFRERRTTQGRSGIPWAESGHQCEKIGKCSPNRPQPVSPIPSLAPLPLHGDAGKPAGHRHAASTSRLRARSGPCLSCLRNLRAFDIYRMIFIEQLFVVPNNTEHVECRTASEQTLLSYLFYHIYAY
jgi:hypothetical protein